MLTKAERNRQYQQRNPEKFRASLKRYWKKPHICECGSVITKGAKCVHIKSQKHCKNMEILKHLKNKGKVTASR